MDEGTTNSIREIYKKRSSLTSLYSPFLPDVMLTRQEWERQITRGLAKYGYCQNIDKLRLLDAGCGNGSRLTFFISLGFSPENLAGVDLIPERIQTAKRLLPSGISLQCADISSYNGGQFDIINSSVVLSSLLGHDLRVNFAQAIWSMLKTGGTIVIYDFVFNNPANPNVRKVTPKDISLLFPHAAISSSKLTLAPPLARNIHASIYPILNAFPVLRTHRLYWIRKS